MTIPRIIHQIWFQGEKNMESTVNMEKWQAQHPGWRYKLWDEPKMRLVISTYYHQYQKKWESFPHMHQKIDFFKYLILDHMGGVYADMDAVPLKPFDSLLDTDTLVVSTMNANAIESRLTFGDIQPINNGIILSPANHPFWKVCLDAILEQTGSYYFKQQEISATTGPEFFSKLIHAYLEAHPGTITILDYTAFEPCYSADMFCTVSGDAYADHQHAQTWLPSWMTWLTKIYYFIKGVIVYFIVMVIVYFIAGWLVKHYSMKT